MPERTLCVGATGAQGGSVARALLRGGRGVRALTRDVHSAAAKDLAQRGAQVVQGDLMDLAQLTSAMEGCDSVFGVTNFWEHFGCEISHGKNLVDAAIQARVPHLVLSTLPSAEALSHGQISVPHLESKAAIEAYARKSNVSVTFVHVAFYFENFLTWFPPRPDQAGTLSFGFPQGTTPLAAVAVEDIGPVVARILTERGRYLGATVGVVGDELRGDQYAAELTRVLEREVRYTHIEREDYARLPFAAADDLAAMFDLNRRFLLTRNPEIQQTRSLHPDALPFSAWAWKNRAQLRAACL